MIHWRLKSTPSKKTDTSEKEVTEMTGMEKIDEMILYDFLNGTGANYNEEGIDDVLRFDKNTLEKRHDYIQWLFPLPELSRHGLSVAISRDLARQWIENDTIRANLLKSYYMMLDFYGIKVISKKPIRLSFDKAFFTWGYSHNRLRISRIIKSMNHFGFKDESMALYEIVMEVCNKKPYMIDKNTRKYWKELKSIYNEDCLGGNTER